MSATSTLASSVSIIAVLQMKHACSTFLEGHPGRLKKQLEHSLGSRSIGAFGAFEIVVYWLHGHFQRSIGQWFLSHRLFLKKYRHRSLFLDGKNCYIVDPLSPSVPLKGVRLDHAHSRKASYTEAAKTGTEEARVQPA